MSFEGYVGGEETVRWESLQAVKPCCKGSPARHTANDDDAPGFHALRRIT